jgi:hypothetical protein
VELNGGTDQMKIGYVICGDNLAGTQPTSEGGTASLQFWRSATYSNESFISLVYRKKRGNSTIF